MNFIKTDKIGSNFRHGVNTIIGEEVKIGNNVTLGHNVIIEGNVIISDDCYIFSGCCIGSPPQHTGFKNKKRGLITIGKGSHLREYVTVHFPLVESASTSIGEDCFIMNHVNIGHDVVIGNNVTISNGAAVGGHSKIDDYSNLGLNCSIHQRTFLGVASMIGMGSQVRKNVPPFTVLKNNKSGFNLIGAQRFSGNNCINSNLIVQCFYDLDNALSLSKEVHVLHQYYKNFNHGELNCQL